MRPAPRTRARPPRTSAPPRPRRSRRPGARTGCDRPPRGRRACRPRSTRSRSSRWFTYAEPIVKPASAVGRSSRSSGRNTSRSLDLVRVVRRHLPVDRHVHLLQRVGARHAPVAAHGEHRPRPHEAPERVLPPPARLPEERDREVVHLRFVRRPERLRVRDRAERPEPRDVVGVHHLQVGQMMAVVARAVREQGGLDRVEPLAHGPLGERVEVHLEPETVELGDVALQRLGLDERDAPVVGGLAMRIEVGLEHGRGVVLADPVLHDLHARRGEAADFPTRPQLDELLDLLGAAVAVPPQRADDPGRQVAAPGGVDVGRVVAPELVVVVDDRVLPGRDAERVQVLLALQQPLGHLRGGRGRRVPGDEVHRPLVQGARRLPVGGALDAPVVGVRASRSSPPPPRARVSSPMPRARHGSAGRRSDRARSRRAAPSSACPRGTRPSPIPRRGSTRARDAPRRRS